MLAILRAGSVLSLLCLGLGLASRGRADAPPPSQALASDPAPPRPSMGLSADAAAIFLGDYAARFDVTVLPPLSVVVILGASHRRATDDVLAELGATAWILGTSLEGPHVSVLVGLAWAGPWSEEESLVIRAGGEAGWQFLWESLSISLAAGAHAAFANGEGSPGVEARARAALGVVF